MWSTIILVGRIETVPSSNYQQLQQNLEYLNLKQIT
jgi:hypothetical protein